MENKSMPTYTGKITNAGLQYIEAPIKTPKAPTPPVVSGKDLRSK
jgi:hypothetical protein